MSERWPGGIISQTAPVPSGSYATSTAPGVWTLEQQAYWQRLGQWPIAGNFPPNIEDVFSTYLYTGSGSSLFINNGIQLGSGVAGGSGGSGSFFSTNSYAQLSTGAAMNFGTGAWTIEFYFQGSPNLFGVIFEIFNSGSGSSQQIAIQRDSSTDNAIYVESGSIRLTTSGATPWDGNWHHHAIVRNVNTVTYYIDGVSRGTYTTSLNLTTSANVRIANWSQSFDYKINGYLSNLRVVSGTAVYTSNFTVPPSALTAISGTQLLCMQGSTPFVDNSPNAFTITAFNGAASSTLGPYPFTSVTGKGGLVWLKSRSQAYWNNLTDTVRGAGFNLWSNDTGASTSIPNGLTAFSSTGFTLGTYANTNQDSQTFASWTFREQAKFFDIVTYTGNGANRTIAHNLGSVPGMIIVKCASAAGYNWVVYHRSLGATQNLVLQTTAAAVNNGAASWNSTAPTSTEFSIGTSGSTNANGETFVAYLFAHDAGGFGLSGNENVISCGSYTGNGSATGPTVNLGYEPQYILIKGDIAAGNWFVFDNMRGIPTGGSDPYLLPNSAAAEDTALGNAVDLNATGFQIRTTSGQLNNNGTTYIYMAIRRGPMATPTVGTSVFSPIASSDTTGTTQTTGFPIDLQVAKYRAFTYTAIWSDRLRGVITTPTDANSPTLESANTTAEASPYVATRYFNNTGFQTPTGWSGSSVAFWNFRRAPGFFDTVCYTGAGATSYAHNLGVVPELIIVKSRSDALTWAVYSATIGANKYLRLQTTDAAITDSGPFGTTPTSTVFYGGGDFPTSYSGYTYVAYLFATVAGVSKVGSYTGTGSTQTINAGLPTGARFVLIKRTDSTGDWWTWDTARGMVAGTDPRIPLNSTSPETNNNWVYTTTTGFQIVTTDATVNASGGTYIYLAIA